MMPMTATTWLLPLCLATVAAPPAEPRSEPPVDQPGAAGRVDGARAEAPVAPDAPPSPLPPPESGIDSRPPPPLPPPGGVGAAGSGAAAPLPPPPARVDPRYVKSGPWRGHGFVGVRFLMGGSLPVGDAPARGNVLLSLGAAVEGGGRINNLLGVGLAIGRQPQHRDEYSAFCYGDQVCSFRSDNSATWFDGFVRIYVPVKRRIQPWFDVGGGALLLDRRFGRQGVDAGGVLRVASGVDFWVSRAVSLNVALLGRGHFIKGTTGGFMHGSFGITVHF